MALVLADRVQETSTTTGTGTFTLAGAVNGFQTFAAIGNGNTTYYVIAGGSEWEVGIGTYTAAGTTLSRDTVLSSSDGGTKVNFSAGQKYVFVTYPEERAIYVNGTSVVIPNSATIANNQLANSTISGVSLGSNLNNVTFNNLGTGDASGTTFNGGAAKTVSYNTVGAPSTTGSNASGTWGIDITGNAATATSATSATNATNATNVGITADGTNASRYVGFYSATTGNLPTYVDAGLTYNPSTNALTATTFSGALSGNATTATTATNLSGGTVSATTGSFSGVTQVTNTTGSTLYTNGALVVSGGVGVAGRTTVNDIVNRITGNGNSAWLQQDGTGRVHWYWNTYGGTSPTFTNGSEDAVAITMHTGGGGNVFFRGASGTGKSAGDPITWTTTLYADLSSFTYKGVSVALVGTAQTFTAAQTFRAANAIRSEAASTQDAVVLAGRAGGTSSYAVTLTPTTLTANRTLTLPNSTGTLLTDATGATKGFSQVMSMVFGL